MYIDLAPFLGFSLTSFESIMEVKILLKDWQDGPKVNDTQVMCLNCRVAMSNRSFHYLGVKVMNIQNQPKSTYNSPPSLPSHVN